MTKHLCAKTLLCFIVFSLIASATQAARSWKTKQPMLTARNHLAIGVVNSKIYAIGGDGMTTNEEYNPVTNSWTAKSPMPSVRYWGFACGVVQGKIYAIGGADAGLYLKTNEEYDPSTDTWTPKTDMSTERFGLAVTVVGNKLYAIGGYNSTGVLSTNEEYDPVTNSWTTKTPMPTARYYLTASVAANKIYLIGGYNPGTGYLSVVEEYDPATDTWTSRTSMPTARGELASESINDTIYAVGGWNGAIDLATAEAYIPASDAWQACPSMPTARSGLAAGNIVDSLYAIGGLQGFSYLTANEQYSPDVTSIQIPSFFVQVGKSCIEIRWRVSLESGLEFYRILKKTKAKYEEIAVFPSGDPSPSPQSYSYRDNDVKSGNKYEYKLGVVKTNGNTQWYGPVSAIVPTSKPFLRISPNPFTSTTVISYSSLVINDQLPMTNDLQYPALRIYDASGRLVKSFSLLSPHSSLITSLTWDGKDDAGKFLSSGIYYSIVKQGGGVKYKKKIQFIR